MIIIIPPQHKYSLTIPVHHRPITITTPNTYTDPCMMYKNAESDTMITLHRYHVLLPPIKTVCFDNRLSDSYKIYLLLYNK